MELFVAGPAYEVQLTSQEMLEKTLKCKSYNGAINTTNQQQQPQQIEIE
jgi:hypothetical protein